MGEVLRITHDLTGNFGEYDGDQDPNGRCSVISAAGLAGTPMGMAVELVGLGAGGEGYYTKAVSIDPAAPGLAFRIELDPTDIPDLGGGGFTTLVQLFAGADLVFEIWFKGDTNIDARVAQDASGYANMTEQPLVKPGRNTVELHVVRAATDSSADGQARFWVNADARVDPPSYESAADRQFYTRLLAADELRVGVCDSNETAGAGEQAYLDELLLRDDLDGIGPQSLPYPYGRHQLNDHVRMGFGAPLTAPGDAEPFDVDGMAGPYQVQGTFDTAGAGNEFAVDGTIDGVNYHELGTEAPGASEAAGTIAIDRGPWLALRPRLVTLDAGAASVRFSGLAEV